MEVSLHIIKGIDSGKTFTYNTPAILLAGRSINSKIKFNQNDLYISRNHFLLEIAPPNCLIKHLSKTNQTFVNNQPITEKILFDNDIIQAGYTFIRVNINKTISISKKECKRCKASFEVNENELTQKFCESCLKEINRPPKSFISTTNDVFCSYCNIKLSNIVNSDGRQAELTNKVKYICPNCIMRSDFLKGEKIGRYEKIKFLAEGGMGEVYLVYDRSTARILVLKKILGLADNALIRRHFEREIIVHKRLNNPNIIHYIDTGIFEGEPFIVMEYADGDNLDAYIEKCNGEVPVKQALQFFIQMTKGVNYLHQLDPPVIHRDIKPANIMLQKNGDNIDAKIADFGLSKPFSEAGGLSFTRIGEVKGSKIYMSPQQIKDTKNANLMSDIYSLGVTAYYLFSGKLPYYYPSVFEQKQIKEKYKDNRRRIKLELEKLGKGRNLLALILTNSTNAMINSSPNTPVEICQIIDNMLDITNKDCNITLVLKNLEYIYEKL